MDNPFTDEYWKQEVAWWCEGLKTAPCSGNIKLDWMQIRGRCDDYLNNNLRFETLEVPRLCIGKNLWMSLTPMEIQSAFLVAHVATGKVITAGLGLGYFTLKVAAKPTVTEVVVYEREQELVDWFKHEFKNRPGFDKVKFVVGDARKTFKGQTADYAFVDIYPDMLPDEVITDAAKFTKANKIKHYTYWGFELVFLEALVQKRIKSLGLPSALMRYFAIWQRTKFSGDDDTLLCQLFQSRLAPDFLKRAMKNVSLPYSEGAF